MKSNPKLKIKPTARIKRFKRIFSSCPHLSYSDKMKIKRKGYLPRVAPKGYGIVSCINSITQARLLSQSKFRYVAKFARWGKIKPNKKRK